MSMAGSSAARGTGEPELDGGDRDREADEVDDWSRRLDRRETVFWYGLAGVTYVVASIFQKSLLNWFVGPLWLVAVVWLGPYLTDRVRRRRPSRAPRASGDR